jgi:hypothetical protein
MEADGFMSITLHAGRLASAIVIEPAGAWQQGSHTRRFSSPGQHELQPKKAASVQLRATGRTPARRSAAGTRLQGGSHKSALRSSCRNLKNVSRRRVLFAKRRISALHSSSTNVVSIRL